MSTNLKLDIQDIDWPISILNCKKEVNQMKSGDRIEVLVKDVDVINNIMALIEPLSNQSIEKHRENNHYRLIIKKK